MSYSCLNSIRRLLFAMGVPGILPPIKIKPDETLDVAASREAEEKLQKAVQATARRLRILNDECNKLSSEALKIIRSGQGQATGLTPQAQMALKSIIDKRRMCQFNIGQVVKQEQTVYSIGSQTSMNAHMTEVQKTINDAVKHLNRTNMFDKKKTEAQFDKADATFDRMNDSLERYGQFMEEQLTNNVGYGNTDEVDLESYMDEIKELENTAADQFSKELDMNQHNSQRAYSRKREEPASQTQQHQQDVEIEIGEEEQRIRAMDRLLNRSSNIQFV